MGWQVVFSIRSRDDLRRIVQFIAREDPAAAERFGLGLIAQTESLASAPQIGMPVPERPGTRFFPFGSYLINLPRGLGKADGQNPQVLAWRPREEAAAVSNIARLRVPPRPAGFVASSQMHPRRLLGSLIN